MTNTTTKPYDPKLRELATKMTELCKEHDCMGAFVLISPTHAEYVNTVDASWSVMRKINNGIRFRSKAEDFLSKEAQHRATESTVHGVTTIIEWAKQTEAMWMHVLSMLRKHMRILHTPWGKPDSVPGDGL